ncbi:hypothetical protein [Asticcacaulis sp.]|uniref:hypothetical protein n=1 Tax=Asticcacaulis sp. TaxID=1872648 RepID=UPI0031DB0500
MKICALLMAIVIHTAAGEPDFVRAENLVLLDRPAIPDLFKEQQMHIDLEATGKSFEVVCIIGSSGYLQNCIAFDEGYPDKAYVRNVREYMQTWRYDTRSKTGESVVGKKARFRWQYTLQ